MIVSPFLHSITWSELQVKDKYFFYLAIAIFGNKKDTLRALYRKQIYVQSTTCVVDHYFNIFFLQKNLHNYVRRFLNALIVQ